jgi:Fe2+ or Zn2+ uptake regulation protein
MTCGAELAPVLRSRGFRVTQQRMAVLHVLRHARRGLSPATIWSEARVALPGLTEATVYRTLDFLSANGFAWAVHTGRGHLVYEMAGARHHHLICRVCGRELEVPHALVKSLYARLEAASGYQVSSDHLTLFGLCPDCRPARGHARG